MNKPRRQCAKCPWKKSTNPRDIPNGYSREKHVALADTIADPDAPKIPYDDEPLRVFACHETHELPCVGWLRNQLGAGNNIALRIAVCRGSIDANVKTVGQQHATFADTVPEEE